MPSSRNHGATRSSDLIADFATVIWAEKTVVFARDHQSRRPDRGQPSAKVELGHALSYVAKEEPWTVAKTRAQASNAARP